MPTGKCGPLTPPFPLLFAQKCRLSLSTHSPAASKRAGRQQGLSRLSDRGAERPRRKGVQPVGCKALVGTAEVLPPDRLSSYTWQVLETQKGELLSRLPTMSVFLPLICWCSFCSFVTQTTKTNKCITEKDKRLFAHHVVASEAFARCLCCVDCLPLYFALLAQSFPTLSAFT